MKKRAPFIILVMVAIGGLAVYLNTRAHSGGNGAVIRVSGNIEITDAEIGFKIAGRVVERAVDEGDAVRKGQVIARLDDAELGQQVSLAKAQLAGAEATLAELVAGSRPEEIAGSEAAASRAQSALDELLAGSRPQEVASAEAAVESAKSGLDNAKAEYDRQQELRSKNVASVRDFDIARTIYEAAQARLTEARERLKLVKEGPRKEDIDQARAALTEAKERLALVKAGPRKETIDQARARVEEGRQLLALAETRLSYATIASPLDGVVLSKNVEPGEYVAPGTPVVTVGDLSNVFLRAYINETDLGRVKLGQKAKVTTDTYRDKSYEGRVSFISPQAEFTPKNVQTPKERVKLVYRVKIQIPNPNAELKAGMPADAQLAAGEKVD